MRMHAWYCWSTDVSKPQTSATNVGALHCIWLARMAAPPPVEQSWSILALMPQMYWLLTGPAQGRRQSKPGMKRSAECWPQEINGMSGGRKIPIMLEFTQKQLHVLGD